VAKAARENTAMKENSPSRVLVRGDYAILARRRATVYESFTTVRFKDRKRSAQSYGTFWYLMSRRFC